MRATGQFIIFRYGTEITRIESSIKTLEQWFRNNLCDKMGEPFPEGVSREWVLNRAEELGYAVRRDEVSEASHAIMMSRLENAMELAPIEKVACHLGGVVQRGKNYVMDKCPFCGGEHTLLISPKHHIFKCFACGKTGSGISLLMESKGITLEEALAYINTNFTKEE